MRIGYVVGRLGRGGAELQMMRLSAALARRGHDVEIFAYDGPSTLDDELRDQGVTVRTAGGGRRWAKRRAVRGWLRAFDPDVVHGIMKRASSLALLARVPNRHPPVLASDMSTATYGRHKPVFWASLAVFGLADLVVTQTELNRRNLERSARWLRGKTVVVRNGVDVERFTHGERSQDEREAVFRFCVVGTVYAVKNPEGVIRAAARLRDQGVSGFEVHWYGRFTMAGDGVAGDGVAGEPNPAVALARELRIEDVVRFHGEIPDVERAYQSADALLHASIQEGFPNAVVEGMACGLPVVVSDVSDLPLVVDTARNGFVFPARDANAMADAMRRMLETPVSERRDMAGRSRDLAVRWFALDRFVREFETVYQDMMGGPA